MLNWISIGGSRRPSSARRARTRSSAGRADILPLSLVASPFKPKSRLEAENAAFTHQVIVLQRKVRGRVQFTNGDRLFFIQLHRRCPSVLKAMMIVRRETVVRWHRAGLRRYWRWKSRTRGGRPNPCGIAGVDR
jgi:hypothetical protein